MNPDLHCPQCGRLNDRATNIGDPKLEPREGDIGVCFACAAVFEFHETGPVIIPDGLIPWEARKEVEAIKRSIIDVNFDRITKGEK